MFNLNNSESNNNFNEKKINSDWLNFSTREKRDRLLETLSVDNKFIKEDMKIREMVINVIDKEFGKEIRNRKDYEFFVDTVINKIKKEQINLWQ